MHILAYTLLCENSHLLIDFTKHNHVAFGASDGNSRGHQGKASVGCSFLFTPPQTKEKRIPSLLSLLKVCITLQRRTGWKIIDRSTFRIDEAYYPQIILFSFLFLLITRFGAISFARLKDTTSFLASYFSFLAFDRPRIKFQNQHFAF